MSGEPISVRSGLLAGIAAYFIWGFFPLFFKLLRHVPPLEVVSHRIVWSFLLLLVIITLRGQWAGLRDALTNRRTVVFLLVTALLISINWLVFIAAVGAGQVLQSSLGYFLTPLVNVLLGVLVLRERLRRWQVVSLLLAASGVAIQIIRVGELPTVALVLAATFGLYGLLRKVAPVSPLYGLTIETGVLILPAAGLLLFTASTAGAGPLVRQPQDLLLLPLAGALTAVPLLLFAAAAQRLRLTTIGFLQYLTPSLHFLQAVFIFREPFGSAHLASFCCIWAGLAIYSLDVARQNRQPS